VIDIPNAFIQTRVEDEKDMAIIRLRGLLVHVLVEIAPLVYRPYATEDKKGAKQLVVKDQNALYGTMVAIPQFYNMLRNSLTGIGFTFNSCDLCVGNKTIDGHQMTICFHVDNCKLSHCNPKVINCSGIGSTGDESTYYSYPFSSMVAGLQKAVQRLVNGTSSHFVPQPTTSAVLEDALNVDSKDYIRWVKAHLNASAKVVSRQHLMNVLQSGQDLLDEMEGMMGEKDVKFVKQSLLSKQIPTPSLLIKDDGLVVFNSKKTKTQIQTWLNDFQLTVDELCGNSFLQFTAVMWHSGGRSSRSTTNLSVDTNPAFPYLDMEMD
jgi:hypothetical protein